MLGILIQLLLSWLIVWWFDKSNLRVLGLLPTQERCRQAALFFLFTALCCASGYGLKWLFFHQRWAVNPLLTFRLVMEGIWWNIKAVLFEELIFRGALLYVLLKKWGAKKAVFLSAASFGVYHWFSQEAFGQPLQMALLFFGTGMLGWLLAKAFVKTGSLHVPVAIHLGWNLTQQVLFSDGPIGDSVLAAVTPKAIHTTSYGLFFFVLLFPLAATIAGNAWLLFRKKKGEAIALKKIG